MASSPSCWDRYKSASVLVAHADHRDPTGQVRFTDRECECLAYADGHARIIRTDTGSQFAGVSRCRPLAAPAWQFGLAARSPEIMLVVMRRSQSSFPACENFNRCRIFIP